MSDPLLQARIYIVDDKRSSGALLKTQLSVAGFEAIWVATSGAKALEMIERQLPDLVLLDVVMPEMDGYQVAAQIRATYPDRFIPIILLSVLENPQDRVKGITAGANDFLTKPYDAWELVARVRSLLSHKLAMDALNAERARALALLNQIGNPVVVTDSAGIITQVNSAAQASLGLDDGVFQRGLADVFGLALEDLLLRAQERGATVSGVFTPRVNGAAPPSVFNVSVSPIQEVGYILLWQDITGLQESERARLDSERAETRHVLDTFFHYMSPALVERVIRDPGIVSRRERRDATVLFADLRGFTRLSIEYPPDDVMSLLNNIFAGLLDIVNRHEGMVFGITGDELMVAFNVPYDQDRPVQRALETAVEMQQHFQKHRASWERRGMHVGLGIGINSGLAVLGHVGGHSQMSYMMVGGAVNIAHRLVELAEDRQIVVTADLLGEGLPVGDDLVVRELEPTLVKGVPYPITPTVIEVAAEGPAG